jgi:hypothetical protein
MVARRLTWRDRARLGIGCDEHKEDAHYGNYENTKSPLFRSTRVWFESHPRDARQITILEPKK